MDTREFTLKFKNPISLTTTTNYDQSTASTQNPRLDVGKITSNITEIFLPRRLYDNDQLEVVISNDDGSWNYNAQVSHSFVGILLDLG